MSRLRRPYLTGLIILAFILTGGTQKPGKNAGFRSPVNYPITLSGAFGEIRRNHFHSGIDIRTGGAEGKPIYAIADGQVARVYVSSGGFGKALYINHPNGYTSVYGHLQRFAGAIAGYVKDEHYRRESFVMDLEVPSGSLRVKKGDVIAYSGNSGSSGGPHLHFEIRETKTQEIIDPLDFDLMPSDGLAPKINSVRIYPHDNRAMVNFTDKPVSLATKGAKGRFHVVQKDTVKVSGNIIFGIETSDAGEGSLKMGVHGITLLIDDKVVFTQDIDRFAFSDTRYVNSVIDYPAFVLHGKKVQRSYIAPNNRLNIYGEVLNRGIVHFSDAAPHKVTYRVSDPFDHEAELVFWVKSHPPPGLGAKPRPGEDGASQAGGQRITYTADNKFSAPGIHLVVPKEAVYEEFLLEYKKTEPVPGTYAPVHHLHHKLTPLHTFCDLRIQCENLPAELRSKAVIVTVGSSGKFSSIGGKYENGWMAGRIREFGKFSVAADTQKPVIKAINITNNKNVSKQSSIRMTISDNLSGIDTYKGTLNGKWILMDFDAKNSLLVYTFDDRLRPGKNEFTLTVTDGVGNRSTYQATLIN